MSSIDIAGFSDVYGSWNTAWTSTSRRCARVSPTIERPSNSMDPPVTGASPRIARPSVVLPDPDSPTRPTVSPGAMSIDTPFSARNV
jgi:hypothetical protein